ncbi:MAG: TonB-dependent receptor [Elusimicrobia bacterium]|nr:TonB-dependent receptor [Elusimicrobiota bacterium]
MKTEKTVICGMFAGLMLISPARIRATDIAITVVTPARTSRAIADVPGEVEVITREQMENISGATLNDKLAGIIPGVASSRTNGIYSFTSVVTMRGLPSTEQGRTLILLDGVPLNTGATGAVNWNRLAFEEIDRIEVFKGPVSSLYGSNAAAGVINIITKKAVSGFRLGTSYGTYNTFGANVGAGARIKKFALSADGSYLSSDGYNSTPEAFRTPYTVNKYVREKNASAKAELDLGEAGIVDAQYSRDEGLRGEGTRIRTVYGVSRQYNTDFARAAWHGDNGTVAWQTQGYYQLEDYSRLNESIKGSVYTRIDTDALRKDTGGQAAVSMPLAGLTATLGADYKLGSVDATDHNWAVGSTPAYDDRDRGRMSQYAPYAQAEKKLFSDKVKLLAAMRYDNARYFDGYFYNPSNSVYNAVNGPQSVHYWDRFSPKVAASWHYSDSMEQYLSYGRGFRPPALEDMCLTMLKGKNASQRFNVANPDLKPETVDTAETGFKLAPATGLYIDPAAYYTIGRDFMYTIDTSDYVNGVRVSKKQNIARVKIYGAELPVKFYSGSFSLSAAYAWSNSEIEKYAGNTALEGKTLAYSPHHTVSASLGLKTAPADLMLAWIYKSKQFTVDDNSAWVGWYHTFSVSATRYLTRTISAKLSVENIFNRRYQEKLDDLAPGRTITVSVAGKF